ncbi:hypothetical protein NIES4103_00310 [Nostoc sp. NIES-4103]|nr:hypothetical protein NIES4103_00310 [Nostoc sp. NIES-4103]
MPRQKRTSRILEKAELRTAGMKSIVPTIKFDDECNLDKLIESIEQLRKKIDIYNTALSVVDSSKTEIKEMEKKLSQLSEKMLMVVAIKYGKDSPEYEMAGGIRISDRISKLRLSRKKNDIEEAANQNAKTA